MSSADMSLHDAVHQLYQSNHAWLYGWLRRRLGCADNAADLAQDTFARILASRRVLDAREPRAYLTTVARACWSTGTAASPWSAPTSTRLPTCRKNWRRRWSSA